MSWLDRTIGWLSPELGLRRLRARAALQVARAYEGAKTGRRTSGWNAAGTSANREIQSALSYLRNRSRDLMRNNPYASKAFNTLVARSVGCGILAKSKYAKQWKAWVKQCDANEQLNLYGLQALAARTMFESGACLIRFRYRRPNDGLAVPLQLQVLEPDYLDTTKFGVSPNGNVIIGGIEFDALGRRVNYWMFSQHPGEVVQLPKFLQSKPVPATDIIYAYEVLRPGQVHGVPRLASSLLKYRDFDDYEEAELVRKKIEACFSVFVTSSTENRTIGDVASDSDASKRIENLEPGLIEYLRPDENITFAAPTINAGYGEYTKTQLHAMAAGSGITYEQLTGDYSQTNYSSSRASLLEFRALVEQWQELTFVPMVCDAIYRKFIDIAYISGAVRQQNYDVTWTTPKWPWVDPVKDVQGIKEEIRGGLTSLSEGIRQRGYDPDEVFAEMAEDQKKLEALGLVVDSNAKVAMSGQGNSSTNSTEQTTKDDNANDSQSKPQD